MTSPGALQINDTAAQNVTREYRIEGWAMRVHDNLEFVDSSAKAMALLLLLAVIAVICAAKMCNKSAPTTGTYRSVNQNDIEALRQAEAEEAARSSIELPKANAGE